MIGSGPNIPLQVIAGFLIVLGVPVVIPENVPTALTDPVPALIAAAVTFLTNPFYGLLIGEAAALLLAVLFGGGPF